MTSKVLNEFKNDIRSLRLIPSKGGCFEVTANDRLIYSKLREGTFPDEDAIVKDLQQLRDP